MIHDVEHLFTYLHVIFISSLVRCLFRSFAHFKTGLLIFWLLIDVLSTVPPGKSLFFFWPGLVAQRVKASVCNAGDLGSIPGLGRSPGEGNGNPLQYSYLENPMDGKA